MTQSWNHHVLVNGLIVEGGSLVHHLLLDVVSCDVVVAQFLHVGVSNLAPLLADSGPGVVVGLEHVPPGLVEPVVVGNPPPVPGDDHPLVVLGTC